jgi:hypothetical protein
MHGRNVARSIAGLLALALTTTGAFGVDTSERAGASPYVPHATLVPELPATGYPKILNTPTFIDLNTTQKREVFAADQVGRYIVAGGDFYEVELQDGTVLQQKYFTAWNIDTKQIVCPNQLTFDNEVLAIAPGPTPTKVYVAGRFNNITGADGVKRTRVKVGLVDLATCSVDTTFVTTGGNGKVEEIVNANGRIFIGGDFTSIGGVAVETIAELDGTTAAVKTAFNFPTVNELTSRIRGLDVNATATRLVVAGRFGTISGNGRSINAPTAVIDISDPNAPVLTAHSSSGYVTVADLQDAGISPDGASVGLVYGTATTSDYVYLTPTTESPVTYTWRHFMRDSSFSVAVTNNAMYVGGHFCKPDAGPGTSDVMAPKMGFDDCTGTRNYTGGVWRSHLAAFSLTDGTPLPWNPGQDSFTGARRIVATTRGLLVGFDGERVNDIRTGALAFFDFGAAVEDVTPPSDVTFTSPAAAATVNNPVTIAGTATDNIAVSRYSVTVQRSDGQYVQADGSLGATVSTFTVTPELDGSFSLPLNLLAGSYTARARARDAAGYSSATNVALSFTATGLETAPPALAVTAPTAAVPRETAVVVTGTATDNVAVATLFVEVRSSAGLYLQDDGTFAAPTNDVAVTITSGGLGTASLGWSLNLGGLLAPDTYTVAVTAADPSGNASTANGTFTVDVAGSAAPTVVLTSPASAISSGTAATVIGTASDNGSIVSVRSQVRNAAGSYLQPDGSFAAPVADRVTTVIGLGTGAVSFSAPVGVLPVGAYTATVIATDAIGNSTSVDRAFQVNVAPTSAITSYTGYRTSNDNLTYGYTFRMNQTMQLHAIGIQDTNGNGVLDNRSSTPVGIWTSTGTLLASGSVPTNAPNDGGWFYTSLGAPLTLQSGTTYVVGVLYSNNGERFARDGTIVTGSAITILRRAQNLTRSFSYPLLQGNGVGYGVPNLRLTPA